MAAERAATIATLAAGVDGITTVAALAADRRLAERQVAGGRPENDVLRLGDSAVCTVARNEGRSAVACADGRGDADVAAAE
jgi:hypothetical protein